MSKLTAAERNALPNSDFAGPNRSYPVEDKAHAANAKARASQHAGPKLKAKVDAKADKKLGKKPPSRVSVKTNKKSGKPSSVRVSFGKEVRR